QVLVDRDLGMKHLERHAMAVAVHGQVHGGHAADTEHALDAVLPAHRSSHASMRSTLGRIAPTQHPGYGPPIEPIDARSRLKRKGCVQPCSPYRRSAPIVASLVRLASRDRKRSIG